MDIQGVLGSVTDDDTIFTFVTLQSDGRLEFGTAGFCIGTFKQDTRRLAGLVGRRTFLRLYENPKDYLYLPKQLPANSRNPQF